MDITTFSKSIAERRLPNRQLNPTITDPSLYLPSQGLWNAVSVAIEMGIPLLLTGEPGSGKTQLAYYLAWYFNLEKPLVFDAQTTSVARDLFYQYDALGHFQYAQTQKEPLSQDQIEKKFVEYQALGKAIQENRQFVVLIDEIDKAPRDLPNNVLTAVEEMRFKVPEIGKIFKAEDSVRPIVILTSNSEKNLPDAFLRRIAYYHISFPTREELFEILKRKTLGFSDIELSPIIEHFEAIRDGYHVKLRKKPATAELIHWALLLQKMNLPVKNLMNISKLTAIEKQKIETSYTVLTKTREDYTALKEWLYK